jgi:hypothetical protein
LAGAIVLAKVDQGVLAESTLQGWLDTALTRQDDRKSAASRSGSIIGGSRRRVLAPLAA